MNREVELRPRTLVTAWSGCGSLTTGLACAERGTRWASLQPRAREPSPRPLQSAAPPQTGHPGPERQPAPPLPSPLPGASALRPVPVTCLTVNGLCRLASSTPRSVRGLLRPFSRPRTTAWAAPTFGRCRFPGRGCPESPRARAGSRTAGSCGNGSRCLRPRQPLPRAAAPRACPPARPGAPKGHRVPCCSRLAVWSPHSPWAGTGRRAHSALSDRRRISPRRPGRRVPPSRTELLRASAEAGGGPGLSHGSQDGTGQVISTPAGSPMHRLDMPGPPRPVARSGSAGRSMARASAGRAPFSP